MQDLLNQEGLKAGQARGRLEGVALGCPWPCSVGHSVAALTWAYSHFRVEICSSFLAIYHLFLLSLCLQYCTSSCHNYSFEYFDVSFKHGHKLRMPPRKQTTRRGKPRKTITNNNNDSISTSPTNVLDTNPASGATFASIEPNNSNEPSMQLEHTAQKGELSAPQSHSTSTETSALDPPEPRSPANPHHGAEFIIEPQPEVKPEATLADDLLSQYDMSEPRQIHFTLHEVDIRRAVQEQFGIVPVDLFLLADQESKTAKDQLETLRTILKEYQTDLVNITDKLSTADKARNDIERKHENCHVELSSLKNSKDDLEISVAEAHRQLAAARAVSTVQQKQLDQHKKNAEDSNLAIKCTALGSNVKDLQDELASLRLKFTAMETDLRETQQHNDQLRHDNVKLEQNRRSIESMFRQVFELPTIMPSVAATMSSE